MKRAWYLPDTYLETRKDRSNSDWSALLTIIWRNDGVIWRDDDMTNWSRWSLSYFGIRRDVVSVLLSNHFSTQQPNNYQTTVLTSSPQCPCSTAKPSSLPMVLTPLLGRFLGDQEETTVRKLDLSHLCFSLNFYFLMFPSQFPFMFPLLTYSQTFFPLSADHPRHSRRRRSKISILLIQETV